MTGPERFNSVGEGTGTLGTLAIKSNIHFIEQRTVKLKGHLLYVRSMH